MKTPLGHPSLPRRRRPSLAALAAPPTRSGSQLGAARQSAAWICRSGWRRVTSQSRGQTRHNQGVRLVDFFVDTPQIFEGVSEVLMPLSMGDPAGIICCEYGQRVSHRINTGGTPAAGQTQILRDRQPTSSFRYNVVNVHAQPTVFFCRQAARATMRRRNAGGIGIGMSQRRYQEGQKRQVHDQPTPRRTTRKKPLWFPKLADRELQVVSP